MKKSEYSLRYIPRYEKDLNEIVDYIVLKLNTPVSALKLVEKLETAILERLHCPVSFEPFQSNRKRKYPYYRIYVENFVVYYVVIDKVVEVRRLLYKGRDADKLIK